MPIHLPSLSRRRFLAGSVAAGIGLLSEAVRAQTFGLADIATHADPDRLALLSDVHVNQNVSYSYRGVNMAERLRRACGQVLDLRDAPAHLLINGDLAHLHGRAADYTAAVRLLSPLRDAGLPVHVALGNHDSREHLRAALPVDAASIELSDANDRHVTLLELPRANVLMLDSLKGTNRMRGALGRPQLDWLAAALDARPDKPAVVFVHHHPEIGFNLIPGGIADTEALLDVLSPRRQAKALFFGHTHVWSQRQRPDGLHLVNLPTTAYTFSFRQPAGWVDARLRPYGMTLELNGISTRNLGQRETVHLQWRA